MLRRFKAQGFKSLADVDIELPRLAVLFGPNAAGKSNLLDAFQMLARAGTERTLADAHASPIRGIPPEAFTLPPGGLAELIAQPRATFVLEADLQISGDSPKPDRPPRPVRARYRLGVAADPAQGVLSVADEYLAKLDRAGNVRDSPRIERQGDKLVVRRSGAAGHPSHEPTGQSHTLLSDVRFAGSRYPLFDQVREEFRNWRTYYLDPGGAMRADASPRETPDIGVHGQHLAPFLYRLKSQRPPAFREVARTLQGIIPAISGLDVDLDTRRGTLDIQIKQDGTTFSSRIISEGTLRVLALCTLAVNAPPSGLIAFEEPENGVQPQRLGGIAELLASAATKRDVQIIVTTHSPLFAADMLHRARAGDADIGLFPCSRSGSSTTIRRLPDDGLFTDIDQLAADLLEEPDERETVAAILRRGWLDG